MPGKEIQHSVDKALLEPWLQAVVQTSQKVRDQVQQPVGKPQYGAVLPHPDKNAVLSEPAYYTAVVPYIHEPGRKTADQPIGKAVPPELYEILDRLCQPLYYNAALEQDRSPYFFSISLIRVNSIVSPTYKVVSR